MNLLRYVWPILNQSWQKKRSARYMICKPIDTHANEIYPLNEKKKRTLILLVIG